ncbi:XRE family transcriptional regulator [Sphingomonas sp. MMS24-JH45]
MHFTVAQCRAARALLDWSVAELAAAASVGVMTVKRLEGGQVVRAEWIERIVAALTDAGVAIIAAGESSRTAEEGVRRNQPPRTDL